MLVWFLRCRSFHLKKKTVPVFISAVEEEQTLYWRIIRCLGTLLGPAFRLVEVCPGFFLISSCTLRIYVCQTS